MNDRTVRMHVIVDGIVQGVGFRFFVFNHASRMNLKGWVRNRINGNVEVLAEGPREDLDRLLILLRQGPSMAQVVNINVEWQTSKLDLPEFTVLPTDY